MFTGIVQGCVHVVSATRKPGLTSFRIALPPALVEGLRQGASVAVDGVCLTVTEIEDTRLSFDAMGETLGRTTLDVLEVGRRVNVERSARIGDEIGGHLVSGHVEETAQIVSVQRSDNNHVVRFEVSASAIDYLFDKGFVSLDGASLTVVDVDRQQRCFDVHFIPETLRVTTFGFKGEGDRVNLEIDPQTRAIVDTVRTVLAQRDDLARR